MQQWKNSKQREIAPVSSVENRWFMAVKQAENELVLKSYGVDTSYTSTVFEVGLNDNKVVLLGIPPPSQSDP